MADPLAYAAQLFELSTFLVLAATEQKLIQKALDRIFEWLLPQVEDIARKLPGRLWRICGPEYCTPPYMNPRMFEPYVIQYETRFIEAIHAGKGYARVHCHGKIKRVLDGILATDCDAIDPIEPPPQGDVELEYVRKNYGKDLVLFGNLEASDLENMTEAEFRIKIRRALDEGTCGEGRGFVLMPSAIPYGRILSTVAMKNLEAMVDEVEKL